MKGKKTVIIFAETGRVGTAQAVKDAYSAEDNSVLALIIGAEEFQSVASRLAVKRLFREDSAAMRFFRTGKEKISELTANMPEKPDLTFKNADPLYRKIQNIFLRYEPETIILTGASVLRVVLSARAKSAPAASVFAVLDDYCCPMNVINPYIDRYFVPNTGVMTTLVNYGVAENRVEITAFPLPKSLKNLEKTEDYFGIDKREKNQSVVLFLAPPSENTTFFETAKQADTLFERAKIVIYSANDKRLSTLAKQKNYAVYYDGANIDKLIINSDIIVGTAFSPYIARALAFNKPYFFVTPITAFEKRIADFAEKNLVGVKPLTPLN